MKVIIVLMVTAILVSGCTNIYIPKSYNLSTVKESMIKACEQEFCNTTLKENEYKIKVYCYCPEGNVIETFDKESRIYKTEQISEGVKPHLSLLQ